MKFDLETTKYLKGELFSSGLNIYFDKEKYPNQTRIENIIDIVRNKNIIHLGCADHLALIEEKISKKRWLHGLMLENTKKCIGIDINKEAVSFINEKLNIKHVYCFDILNDDLKIINDSNWDYIVLGEIIEHIDNPVFFLKQINDKYKGKISKLLITAPNVYNLLTIKDIKNNLENINTDHRYWFSPFTLSKILINSGYTEINISFAERIKLPFFLAIKRRLRLALNLSTSFNANCFSSIIIEAKF